MITITIKIMNQEIRGSLSLTNRPILILIVILIVISCPREDYDYDYDYD